MDPPPDDPAGRLQFLAQHLQYVEQIIAKLPLPGYIAEDQALRDMNSVRDLLDKLKDVTVSTAFQLPGDVMRNVILGLWHVCNYGVKVHSPEWRQLALTNKVMTAAELEQDYLARLGVMQVIIRIQQSGALNPLFAKKGSITSLGEPITTIAIVAIVATAVVLVALGYALMQWTVLSLNNKKILDRLDKICFDSQGRPIEAVKADCVKAYQDANDKLNTQGPKNPIEDLVKYAAIGGAVYLGVLFLPDIVRTLRETRAASKA
jgi:hypothetical protein